MTKQDIAKQYAESFRLKAEISGWYEQKCTDFLAGYDRNEKELLEAKEIIKHLLVINNVDGNVVPKYSIQEIIKIIDAATKITKS